MIRLHRLRAQEVASHLNASFSHSRSAHAKTRKVYKRQGHDLMVSSPVFDRENPEE
jgi:hypothetical protein